jgi:hypothetical protein
MAGTVRAAGAAAVVWIFVSVEADCRFVPAATAGRVTSVTAARMATVRIENVFSILSFTPFKIIYQPFQLMRMNITKYEELFMRN